MRALVLPVVWCLCVVLPASAQLSDTFSDGDFTRDPAWSGTADRFAVDTLGGSPALRSDGVAGRDTVYLSVPSATAYGVWSFTFTHRGVNLSSFNGARVFLVADRAALDGPVRGYFLQFGTNNSDEVRLYRQDGDPAAGRVELGQSRAVLGAGTTTLRLSVARSPADVWTVVAGPDTLLTAHDRRYREGTHFGFWVKHTEEGRAGFYLDDLSVQGLVVEADRQPPALRSVGYLDELPGLEVTFTEALDPSSLLPGAFRIEGHAPPSGVEAVAHEPSVVRLRLPAPLAPGSYALLVSGVADRAGNPIDPGTRAAFEVEPGALLPPARGDIVVNEILYDPPRDLPEFVELFNRASRPFDLRHLAVADSRRQPVPVTTTPRVLPPGGYVVLAEDSAAFAAAFPGVAVVAPPRWPSLNDGGDTVSLLAGTDEIDAVAYLPPWGGHGVSLERLDPDGPPVARNFGSSTAGGGATPGGRNSRYAPDRTAPAVHFAEQHGAESLTLFFDEPLDPGSLPHARLLVDGSPAASVEVATDSSLVLQLAGPLSEGRLQVEGVRDLAGNAAPRTDHAVSRMAHPGDVVVNEILFAPQADRFDERPDQPEYVELFNRASYPVSLRGWHKTGRVDEDGDADTLHLADALTSLPPGGFAVVYAAPAGEPYDGAALATAFAEPPMAPALLPVRASSLGLANGGDLLRIHRRDGVPVDTVPYDAGWHDPALATAGGISLERIDPDAPSDRREAWSSSRAPAGGTPGGPNSVRTVPGVRAPSAGELIVNEILFAPAGVSGGEAGQPQFVELHNTGTAALDLHGVYWAEGSTEGGEDTVHVSGAPVRLPSGGYAVVFNAPAASGAAGPTASLLAAFPSVPPDALLLPIRGGSLGLTRAGGTLRLFGGDGVLLDATGYGPAWHHPGLASADGVSLERVGPGGGTGADHWTSSVDPTGATPGRANSIHAPGAREGAPGVVVAPSPFSVERDGVAVVRFTLSTRDALVRTRVFDARGRLVRTLSEAQLAGRTGQLLWDGLDDAGRPLRIGIYLVHLEAVDPAGGTVEAYRAPVVLARPFE